MHPIQKNGIIIQNLHEEFEENSLELSNDLKRLKAVHQALKSVLNLTAKEKNNIAQNEFEIMLNKTFTTPSWSPSSFVLIELKNSGALTRLNNNELKKLLFKWEREFSKMKSIQTGYDQYAREYIEFITKYGSVRNLDAITGTIPDLNKSIITKNPISFLKEPEFENRIENFYFLADRLITEYEKLFLLMKNIITLTGDK